MRFLSEADLLGRQIAVAREQPRLVVGRAQSGEQRIYPGKQPHHGGPPAII
jgi:hypothetical protein